MCGYQGVIFFFTAVRELADDRLRFKLDCEANSRQYGVACGGSFAPTPAEQISVGDLVFTTLFKSKGNDGLLADSSPTLR